MSVGEQENASTDTIRSEIRERHSRWNPVYVAAILAELERVTYQLRPIRLFYRPK